MKYEIDDRALADFIKELCPEYIDVRAMSEAQQFLSRKGRAVPQPGPAPRRIGAMVEQLHAEQLRSESCDHKWAQVGAISIGCEKCGALKVIS